MPTRRLQAERLENRTVLSTAPLPVTAPPGETLAQYLAQAHPMGPIAPSQAMSADGAPIDALATAISPSSVDQWFAADHGEGEGDGGSGASGSGGSSSSGSGASSGSGSGATSGSGSGASSGSGSGGSSGSGNSVDTPPTISDPQVATIDDTLTLKGSVDDDGGLDALTWTLDGGIGSITVNDDGRFTVTITDMQGNSQFSITATDANGNSTSYTFSRYS
jgi:hypothetical protein